MKYRIFQNVPHKQKGQFAITLAEVLVSTGLVIGAAFQVEIFWQDYQFESYYNELKTIETAMWDYKSETGQWPGDCDSDGVIDFGLIASGTTFKSNKKCAYDVRSNEAKTQFFKDLAEVNMLSDILRKKFGEFGEQSLQLAHKSKNEAKPQNVLVAFDVSTELAQWLDNKIDGVLSANEGRIRLWDESERQSWPKTEEITRVNIVYYFDSKVQN